MIGSTCSYLIEDCSQINLCYWSTTSSSSIALFSFSSPNMQLFEHLNVVFKPFSTPSLCWSDQLNFIIRNFRPKKSKWSVHSGKCQSDNCRRTNDKWKETFLRKNWHFSHQTSISFKVINYFINQGPFLRHLVVALRKLIHFVPMLWPFNSWTFSLKALF